MKKTKKILIVVVALLLVSVLSSCNLSAQKGKIKYFYYHESFIGMHRNADGPFATTFRQDGALYILKKPVTLKTEKGTLEVNRCYYATPQCGTHVQKNASEIVLVGVLSTNDTENFNGSKISEDEYSEIYPVLDVNGKVIKGASQVYSPDSFLTPTEGYAETCLLRMDFSLKKQNLNKPIKISLFGEETYLNLEKVQGTKSREEWGTTIVDGNILTTAIPYNKDGKLAFYINIFQGPLSYTEAEKSLLTHKVRSFWNEKTTFSDISLVDAKGKVVPLNESLTNIPGNIIVFNVDYKEGEEYDLNIRLPANEEFKDETLKFEQMQIKAEE